MCPALCQALGMLCASARRSANTRMKVELGPEADASPMEDAFCLLDSSRPAAEWQGWPTAPGLFLNQGLQSSKKISGWGLKQNTPKNASLVSTSGGRNNSAGAGSGVSHSFLSAHSTFHPALRWALRGHAQSRTPWRSSWRTQVAPSRCDQDWGQEDARTAPGQTWSSFHCEGTEAEGKAGVRGPGRSWRREALSPASNPGVRCPASGAGASACRVLPARSWNWAGRRNLGRRRGILAALPVAGGCGGPGQGDPAGGR